MQTGNQNPVEVASLQPSTGEAGTEVNPEGRSRGGAAEWTSGGWPKSGRSMWGQSGAREPQGWGETNRCPLSPMQQLQYAEMEAQSIRGHLS